MNSDEKHGAELMAGYLRFLRLEKNFTANTVDAYRKDVEKLLVYFGSEGIVPEKATLEQLETFAAGPFSRRRATAAPTRSCRAWSACCTRRCGTGSRH